MTVRLYEPQAGLWRIWRASTRRPGLLDPPMEGHFTGDYHGVFIGDDQVAGKPIKSPFRPVRRQARTVLGAGLLLPNGVMSFARPVCLIPCDEPGRLAASRRSPTRHLPQSSE